MGTTILLIVLAVIIGFIYLMRRNSRLKKKAKKDI
jgi:preprotein translocase subunit YajC